MQRQVRDFIASCSDCQCANPLPTPKSAFILPLCVRRHSKGYILGFFLPITCTKRGNVGLVAVIDGFSKYVSLHPDRAFTSQQIINFFVTEYVPNFVVPRSIFSDNARAFKCNLFKSLNFNWGILHITTSAFYAKPNNVERIFSSLETALTIFDHSIESNWGDSHC